MNNPSPLRHPEARACGHRSLNARAGLNFLSELAGAAALFLLLIAGLCPHLAVADAAWPLSGQHRPCRRTRAGVLRQPYSVPAPQTRHRAGRVPRGQRGADAHQQRPAVAPLERLPGLPAEPRPRSSAADEKASGPGSRGGDRMVEERGSEWAVNGMTFSAICQLASR